MTQESIVLSTTPPFPGPAAVAAINKANQAIATDFAGAVDPAALAGPYMTWADTGNMLLKRRNAAGTAWVDLGPLLDYHYTRGGILGTVSQLAGVPTGAIIESGSNANGTYTRLASGRQICTLHDTQLSQNVSSAAGNIFASSGEQSWTFPASFLAGTSPAVMGWVIQGVPFSWFGLGSAGSGGPTSATFRVYSTTSIAAKPTVSLLAVGNWF